MEVIIGKNAGFCYGVERAVENTKKELENNNGLYCLGELVHNSRVVKELEEKGLKTVDDINECVGKTIIRAHGISKRIYEDAKEKGVELIDLTCPNVLKIHEMIEKYANDNYFIFIIGNKKHPETIGSYGMAGKNSSVIETQEDIEVALESLKNSKKSKLLVVVQTTFSLSKFNEFIGIIKEKVSVSHIGVNIGLEVKNTICNTTKLRQEETKEMTKNVDGMIIIGGKNSFNTKKLYEIAVSNCENTFLIEEVNELKGFKQKLKKCRKIGIMAGASTSKEHVEETKKFIISM